jgi:hypothetical protein
MPTLDSMDSMEDNPPSSPMSPPTFMTPLPTPTAPPLPSVDNSCTIPTLHLGQVSSFRWRGTRQSKPIVAYIESFCSDVLMLLKHSLKTKLFYPQTIITGTQVDPSITILSTLAPAVWEVNAIRVQSLRVQLAFRLSSNEV